MIVVAFRTPPEPKILRVSNTPLPAGRQALKGE